MKDFHHVLHSHKKADNSNNIINTRYVYIASDISLAQRTPRPIPLALVISYLFT